MTQNKTVQAFFEGQTAWKELLLHLRGILLAMDLEETLKWNFPVYTSGGKNIAGLGSFSSYAGIWFFQGALLQDPAGKLINAQEGKTQAMRQWRFTSISEIDETLIRRYVEEAIQNQKEGRMIRPNRNKTLPIPEILDEAFDQDPALKTSFFKLTPGRQREYSTYILEAKRAQTRLQRLEKIIPMILAGVGLNEKYK